MSIDLVHIGVVILAAGKGTRLDYPDSPKVMAPIGGRPIVDYIVATLERVGFKPSQIAMVVGYREEKVRDFFKQRVTFVTQTELLGTAHAAHTGMSILSKDIQQVLVFGGDDSAFYTPATIEWLVQQHLENSAVLTLLTAIVDHPDQLGRIVRPSDGAVEIIEKEYLTSEQKLIREISTGTFVFNRQWFESIFPTMPRLRKLNEYGLPTALAIAHNTQEKYQVVLLADSNEWFGVNTPEELAEADRKKMGE
jgi:bifunctional N-acetylglucosamine-1-phosphate-uridyltransferase/glucosamine-1-phosphate-acetyltransferase GlmU-like protein